MRAGKKLLQRLEDGETRVSSGYLLQVCRSRAQIVVLCIVVPSKINFVSSIVTECTYS